MRAAVRYAYGTPDVVEVREFDTPTPGEGQILVHVRASSINRADLDYLTPRPQFIRSFIGLRKPRNPRFGLDVAGEVEAVGPGVTRFKPGDAVFADLYPYGQGAHADYVCDKARAFQPIPAGMSYEVAATLPHSAILAIQGLRRRNGRAVGPGSKVLIVGASGNVGPFAVQIAKSLGAEVTGICSPSKVDFVRSLGADHVIDYTKVDYTKTGERYDWILDTDSHQPIRRARRALRTGGLYVTLGGTARQILAGIVIGPLASLGSDRWAGLMLWWKPFKAEDVTTLGQMVADGRITPHIDRRFPLSEVRQALQYVADGHPQGKVLITP
jgi:NADPH:quinone reductase-like Zn-dependent oxidoreductase